MTPAGNKDTINSIIEKNVSVPYKLVKYLPDKQEAWDKMVDQSVNGTLLHTRKFLSYHGNKFADQSILAYDENSILRAIFPAAIDPQNNDVIASHPGTTYGGLVHDGWLRGQRSIDLLIQLCRFYSNAGFKKLIYKAVPWIYHRIPAQDDIYALFRLKAHPYRLDLSTTINLQNRAPVTERRKRLLKKAIKSDLLISNDFEKIDAYWNILAQNLNHKYNKAPVHTITELILLKNLFPQQIELITASINNEVLAGSLLFHTPTLTHAQYLAASTMGKETAALDLVIEYCLEEAKQLGKRYFDFGISTDQQGSFLNDTLHAYKCEFGGAGTIYEFFELDLNNQYVFL